MLVQPDCIPCYVKQTISTLRVAGMRDEDISPLIYKLMDIIPTLSLKATPCENSSIILHRAYGLMGQFDPYAKAKSDWNQYALKEYDYFKDLVAKSSDPLLTAFKIAVAGNIIDMGITPDFDINLALDEITKKDFDHSDYEEFKNEIRGKKLILILGDNSGEIVFDKVLVEELIGLGHEIVYAVKEGPILNDATFNDAEEVGLNSLCRVITTGNNYLGVAMDRCSVEFLTVMKKADIVISKGQANYESLEGNVDAGIKTFFVLRAKCQLVADCLGANLGDIVLKRNRS